MTAPSVLTALAVLTALVCVAASLPALALALQGLRRAPQPWRRTLWLITAGGLAARMLVPDRWVMFYTGYELVDAAVRLDPLGPLLSKYGSATFVLHHLVQRMAGADLPTWIGVNRLAGALLAPLAAALLRAVGGSWRAAVITAFLVAATPLLVRDAASESQLVMVTAWMLGGGVLWARILASRTPRRGAQISPAIGMTALLGASVHGRPEALVLVPVLLVGIAWLMRPKQHARKRPPTDVAATDVAATRGWPVPREGWLALALLGGCAAVRIWQLRAGLSTQLGLGNTPKLFEVSPFVLVMTALTDGVYRKSLLLRPSLAPLATTAVVVAGLAASVLRGASVRAIIGWLLFALAVQTVATLDLPWLSLTRVEAPALVWSALAAGVSADRLLAWRSAAHSDRRSARRPAGRSATVLGAVGLVLWAISAAATIPALNQRTLADDEHDLLTFAYGHMRPGDTLAYRGWEDPPDERLHLHFPRAARPVGTAVIHLSQIDHARQRTQARRGTSPGRVLVLLGTRCHMRRCDRAAIHPACAAVRRRYRLTPLLERDVMASDDPLPWPFTPAARAQVAGVQPQLDFPWCIRRGPLRIGVYVIAGDATAPPP